MRSVPRRHALIIGLVLLVIAGTAIAAPDRYLAPWTWSEPALEDISGDSASIIRTRLQQARSAAGSGDLSAFPMEDLETVMGRLRQQCQANASHCVDDLRQQARQQIYTGYHPLMAVWSADLLYRAARQRLRDDLLPPDQAHLERLLQALHRKGWVVMGLLDCRQYGLQGQRCYEVIRRHLTDRNWTAAAGRRGSRLTWTGAPDLFEQIADTNSRIARRTDVPHVTLVAWYQNALLTVCWEAAATDPVQCLRGRQPGGANERLRDLARSINATARAGN